MAAVVLDELTKVYDNGFRAVKGLNLDVVDGEFLVLVGPSGCGKSTALRMIAGLEDITSGTLTIGERVVNNVAPKDRDIAMVFQNYALYPHMTVFDNIAFALKLAKVPREEIDTRVRDAANVLELTDFLNRKPGQLSGGQRQRVAMGRAIVRQPAAFLMDEPLSNLDAKLRVQMRAEIARIQRDLGVTTIYVTHDQVEAMTMADRVAVLRDGFLQQVAKPQDLYDHPVNLFVAAFIGSPAMNLFEGTISAQNGTLSVTLGSQQLRVPDSLAAARPALRSYDGRSVIVGIRPEDLEDAAVKADHPADARMRANVELVEALGSELVVHLWVDAPPAQSGDPDAIEMLDFSGHEGPGSICVGRFSARSDVRLAQGAEVAVDTERLYFFDPEAGSVIAE